MKILLIEDHAPTRHLVRRSLEAQSERVELATGMKEGLERAQGTAFDVIIIDVELPDGSGLELCRALRGLGYATPILFLTARGEVADRITGLEAGADDYLRKPFSLAELHARLRALTRRNRVRYPPLLTGPDWSLDCGRRLLLQAGIEVPVTSREWDVLDELVGHAGQLVSRDDLLAHAWGKPGGAASVSLDTILSRIRRKLAGLSNGPKIRTVRGSGYVLELPA